MNSVKSDFSNRQRLGHCLRISEEGPGIITSNPYSAINVPFNSNLRHIFVAKKRSYSKNRKTARGISKPVNIAKYILSD